MLPVACETFSLSNRSRRFLRFAILQAHGIVRRGNFVNCCVAFVILPLNGTSPMRRNLSWLPLVVLALSAGGTIALAQPQGPFNAQMQGGMPQPNNMAGGMPNRAPGMGGGMMLNSGTCSKCKKEVTWTGTTAPSSCPHCGVRIGYVEGADGSRTTTSGAKISSVGKYVGIAVVVIGLIIFAAVKISQSGSSRPKRSAQRRKTRRPRPRDEDDED